MRTTLSKQCASLLLSQQGKCASCGRALSDETGWHDHHLVPRVVGASGALSNRVQLHPVCQVQLHANGLTVVKPASE
jgi:RNA-directed DNA polymerase